MHQYDQNYNAVIDGLSQHRPGQRIYVPKSMPAAHWMAEALGHECAKEFAQNYGGCYIDLPTSRFKKSLKGQILNAEGSLNEIARRFNVTRGYVRQLRRIKEG